MGRVRKAQWGYYKGASQKKIHLGNGTLQKVVAFFSKAGTVGATRASI